MSSPLFNGSNIFDCFTDLSGDTLSEGCLWVPNYTAIYQPIHFESETGDFTLIHGYPNMDWIFEGYISGTSQTQFNTLIQGIQNAIDDGVATNYRTLVDSFGNCYDNAQVRTLSYIEPPHVWVWNNAGTLAYGYIAKVKVTGIIQGNTHIGATS